MTSISAPPAVVLRLPTWGELRRAMLTRTPVLITGIVVLGLIALTTIIGIVFLVYTGHDAVAISAAVGAPLIALLASLNRRVSAMHDDVKSGPGGG